MATTRSGWCRLTFPSLLPSDRVSRPSMSTQGIPLTDKVGQHDTIIPYMHWLTPEGFTLIYPLHAHVNPEHTFTLAIGSVWPQWWWCSSCDISSALCSRHSKHISGFTAPICFLWVLRMVAAADPLGAASVSSEVKLILGGSFFTLFLREDVFLAWICLFSFFWQVFLFSRLYRLYHKCYYSMFIIPLLKWTSEPCLTVQADIFSKSAHRPLVNPIFILYIRNTQLPFTKLNCFNFFFSF